MLHFITALKKQLEMLTVAQSGGDADQARARQKEGKESGSAIQGWSISLSPYTRLVLEAMPNLLEFVDCAERRERLISCGTKSHLLGILATIA